MAEVATAYVTLLPSAKGFAKGIQGQVGSDLKTAGRTGGKTYGTGMAAGVAAMAKKVVAPLAAAFAGVKILDFFKGSVEAASNFQQAIGGAESVFKDEVSGIRAAAEDAAMALGLPKNAYLELATTLGASLKNKGIEDFTDQTQNLITIGGDLAATFGGTTKDAVSALGAALRGEADPIERYGINLNEAAVNAKLVEMGVAKTNGAFTEQEKTLARLALIQEQSADAQGQFARESDTLAGSQERLRANWENIKTDIGTALLPALTSLSNWFLEDGLPAIREFGGWLRDDLWPALKRGYDEIAPSLKAGLDVLKDAIGENEGTWRSLGDFITGILIPVLSTIIKTWIPLLVGQWKVLIEIVKGVGAAFQAFDRLVRSVLSAVISKIGDLMDHWADMLGALGKVPGFGWAADAAEKLRNAAAKADTLAASIRNIPRSWGVTVGVRTVYTSTGTPGALSTSTLGGVLAGRASGGPVSAGTPYIVGEKRPELFVPKQDGYILPRVPTSTPAPFGDSGLVGLRISGELGLDGRLTGVIESVDDFTSNAPMRSRMASGVR